jgi:hypothetical protein
MKKLITLLVVVVCFGSFVQAKTTIKKTTVLFNTAKHKLTQTAVKELTQIIKNTKVNLDYEILIEGHTDNRGNLQYNKNLSLNRAEEVKQFLIENGIEEKLITINYLGELDPEKPNSNDENMEANRRVEVTITSYHFDSIEELEDALNPNKTNSYIINPDEETIIKGKKGVKILIQPNTFIYEDGTPVTENIKFELTESLDYKDFISSGLLTKSAGILLESGGMIKVNATTISGKPVKINSNMEMIVAIPNKNRKDNMEVFISDKGDDWITKNQPITKKAYSIVKTPFPLMKDVNIKLPRFVVDESDKPKAPIYPKLAREPHEPKSQSYIREIPWYKFNKDKIRAKQEADYNKAMERYDKRFEKYETKVEKYNQRVITFDIAQAKYDADMICWKEKVVEERKAFKQTDNYLALLKKHNSIYQRNLSKYKEALKLWREKRKLAMEKAGQNMDKLGITNKEAMNNYVFAFNELSWINVDRFYHLKQAQKQLITLKGKNIGNERVLILFKNIGSMLNMYPNIETQEYTQNGFPKNEEAIIFAYKVQNGKPMLCYREIDGREDYQLDFLPTSFYEIKAILSQFDRQQKS